MKKFLILLAIMIVSFSILVVLIFLYPEAYDLLWLKFIFEAIGFIALAAILEPVDAYLRSCK